MCHAILVLNLFNLMFFFLNPQCGNAGCASIATCCPPSDLKCYQQSITGYICHCDQYCISIQDCCGDYADYCINRGENT